MPFHKSAGAVLYRKNKSQKEYLLLHYPSKKGGHWDFPKGHVEKGENKIDTVKREVEEETGFKDIKIIDGFKTYIKYFFRDYEDPQKTAFKIVDFYLAQVAPEAQAKISWEHIGFEWLPYNKALGRITYKKSKEVLEEAHKFLSNLKK